MFKKKYSGGQNYNALSYAEKGMIDKKLEKVSSAKMAKFAKRLLPNLKKQEMARIKKVRGNNQ
jgi:hypothetical protein